MKFHPYSDIFPKLSDSELRELADDIKANGLHEQIWTYKNQILDGRNRFSACVLAGVKAVFRTFKGSDADALAFVVSANIHRRHLTVEQRAFAASRIAALREGANQHSSVKAAINDEPASRDASSKSPTQGAAAEQLGVSRSSVQRARKIDEKGSAALRKAAEAGEVPLRRAAAVVDLPKSEQLAAAQKSSEKAPEPDVSDDWMPGEDEEQRLAALEKEYTASIEKVMGADDKLAAAHTEIKRQAAEIATLKISRDGWQNRCGEQVRIIKALKAKLAKLEKKAA